MNMIDYTKSQYYPFWKNIIGEIWAKILTLNIVATIDPLDINQIRRVGNRRTWNKSFIIPSVMDLTSGSVHMDCLSDFLVDKYEGEFEDLQYEIEVRCEYVQEDNVNTIQLQFSRNNILNNQITKAHNKVLQMRQIEIPELKFTNWIKWENRRHIPNNQYPGAYLIAITSKALEDSKPQWNDVKYIGMTNSKKGLLGRLNQFNRSILGGSGHSGGKTVYEDLGSYETWDLNLFVATMSVNCNTENPTDEDYIKMGWVTYFEYEAFAEYYKNAGGHPKYNQR